MVEVACGPHLCSFARSLVLRSWTGNNSTVKIEVGNLKKLQAAAKFKKAAQKLIAMQRMAGLAAKMKAAES